MPKYSQIEKIQKEGVEIYQKKYCRYIHGYVLSRSSFDIRKHLFEA